MSLQAIIFVTIYIIYFFFVFKSNKKFTLVNQAWDLGSNCFHYFIFLFWKILKLIFIIDAFQKILNVSNDFDQGTYSVMRVELHLRRRSLYFVYNLIFPTCIISILCLIGFILPASSGEKVVLEITNYLAIIFFSQYVAEILPRSSLGIPRICKNLFLIFFKIILIL